MSVIARSIESDPIDFHKRSIRDRFMKPDPFVALALLALFFVFIVWESSGAAFITRVNTILHLDYSGVPYLDKLGHFFLFGAFAWIAVSLSSPFFLIKKGFLIMSALILVATVLVGVGYEWMQSFTAGRTASVYDVFADLAGAAAFLFVWKIAMYAQNFQQGAK